jgi:hypothetical protein
MKGRRQVKEGFLSLETIETWIVYVCHSEGERSVTTKIQASLLTQLPEWKETTQGLSP